MRLPGWVSRAIIGTAAALALLMSAAAAGARPIASAQGDTCPPANGDTYSSAVLADGPAAYYRLDESAGSPMCDSSSSGNNGSYGPDLGYGQPGALAGDSDTAVQANGTSGQIGVSNSDSGLTGNASFTLEGWFKETGNTQNQALVGLGSAGTPGTAIGLAIWHNHACGSGDANSFASSLAVDEYGASSCWDTSTVGVNLYDGQWHYLAVTYQANTNGSPGTITGYVDGQSVGTDTTTPFLVAAPVRVGNGVDTAVNQPFVGEADEVAVYPSALTSEQIGDHFDAGQPAIGFSTTSAQANPSGPDGGTRVCRSRSPARAGPATR